MSINFRLGAVAEEKVPGRPKIGDRGHDTLGNKSGLYTREELHEWNPAYAVADSRNIPELNHVHTEGYSDGSDPIHNLVQHAAELKIPYLNFADHADAGFIKDEPGYYGQGYFDDPESLDMSVTQHLEDGEELSEAESFEIYLSRGMELNYHEGYEEEIQSFIDENREYLDNVILSVHHDAEGNNLGRESHMDEGMDPYAKLEEYFNSLGHAAEFADSEPLVTSIAHFYRPENNPFFRCSISPSDFRRFSRDFVQGSRNYEVRIENNAKTDIRSMIQFGRMPVGRDVLIEEDVPMTGGTDTHRIGNSSKVPYKVSESERRLQAIEEVAEQCENMEPILPKLDLEEKQSIKIPVGTVEEGFFRHSTNFS